MPDKNLLVPGTQATTLRDDAGTTVYNAVRVSLGLQKSDLGGRPPAEWQRLLSVEYEPGSLIPKRTSLEPGTEISPGPVVMTPYDRLPKPLETFPYDWRLDMRSNAQTLLDRLRDEKPADGRWNLIGHSQGGLVIVLSSLYTADPHEFARLVARVVLIGTPMAGTMRALEALVVGRGDFGDDPALWDTARGMAQSWPALYQMLPAWDAVVDPAGDPLPEAKQFLQIGGYPSFWKDGIAEALLQRSRETRLMLEGPLSRFGTGVTTLIVQGEKHDTPVRITRDGTDFARTGQQRGSRPELAPVPESGDGLVPGEETLVWSGPTYRSRTLRIGGKVKEHAFLCDGKFLVKKVDAFLRAEAPPAP